ncbi:MAG: hypothetical protein M9894_39685 [Planctomycetes bacterium]|nr:hypothetical protein [Planctomycetota bacterium]
MNLLEKIVSSVRARRETESQAAATTYGELVARLSADKPAKADTADVVDELLQRSGRTPEELVEDVERVRAHRALRQRCRAVLSLRQQSHDADERLESAFHGEQAEHRRLRAATEAASHGAREASRQAQEGEASLRDVLAVAPSDLVAAFSEAEGKWRNVLGAIEQARMAARDQWSAVAPPLQPRDPAKLARLEAELAEAEAERAEVEKRPFMPVNGQPDPAYAKARARVTRARAELDGERYAAPEHGGEVLAKLEQEAAQARAAADRALAAVLAYEPSHTALRRSPAGVA